MLKNVHLLLFLLLPTTLRFQLHHLQLLSSFIFSFINKKENKKNNNLKKIKKLANVYVEKHKKLLALDLCSFTGKGMIFGICEEYFT